MSRVLLMLYAQQTSANLPLSEALYHADVFWYHSLAENGYDSEPKAQMFIYAANWAFFPLYPMAVRFLANVSDMQIPITGIVLSNTAFAFTLVLLYRYTLQLTDKPTAQIITALMAISPFSLYYSLMYTEGLYTVLMIAIMLSAKNNRWITAGILGALLSATRVLGVMIVFPLLAIAVNQHGFKQLLKVRTGTEPALFAIMIVPLGLFAYMLFLYDFTGDALAFMHIQWAWARELHNPLVYLFGGFINDRGWINYNALLALSGITGGIYLWRKQLEPEALILLIGTFIPLSTGLASLQRYVGTLFPFMILIGLLIRNRPLLTGATFLLFAFLFLFYVWSWTHGHWYMI
ncbi:MAG: hypothetical protein MI685_11785 [Chlorobiales bacterium]|nr:hypothetical protein [Chlorobiales bacterium]